MNDIFYSRQTQCPTRCKPNKKVPNYRMKSCQLSIKKSLRTKDYLYPKAWDRHPQPWDRYPQPWDMCPQPANKDYRYRHHSHGTALSYSITCQAHCYRKYRTAEEPHNHQTGNLVLLLWHSKQRLGEDNRKDVRIAETDKGNADVYHCLFMENEQPYHRSQHT